jgi:gamma-glutamylcyclotransferase (GGCT)/AIG2-like uncharacterized protein YtfP
MVTPLNYHLFVYGSLRSGFRSPAYEYMSQYFTLISEGRVRGKLYDLGEYVAGKLSDEDSFIIGELYKIKTEDEFSWAIGQLDDYEGIAAENGEPQLFRRELVDVITADGVKQSWIYWFNGDITGSPFISSGDMMQYIQEKKRP